jgi:hypothetical protein
MEEAAAPRPEEILEHLQLWQTKTLDTVDLLRAHRRQIEERSNRLENPRAVLEYIDFFVEYFARTAAELQRIATELAKGPDTEHGAALRQVGSNASLEQRRCVIFRDLYINKPLPYEEMRPLLNQISLDTRDQLLEYRELMAEAERVDQLRGRAPDPDGPSFDRRSLFTRFLPKRS